VREGNRELWWAFFAILLITLVYLFVITLTGEIPAAQGLFGHSIGIIGFILMLMTETLYSIRKRRRAAGWGRMSNWLQFHIFTGLVGPYMVLLHSSWKFNGLAGIVTLLTIIIVLSGFIGRYIYTQVPRTVDGLEVEADELKRQMGLIQDQLESFLTKAPDTSQGLIWRFSISPAGTAIASGPGLNGLVEDWKRRWQWIKDKRRLGSEARPQIEQLEKLLKRRRVLQRQANSLANARRMLALWHTIHIPIGMVLFTAAFIHIMAATYFAILLR
jgi:hypothetical protein